jgi:ATP-dependent protease Clp ATPase subunit
MEADMSDPDTPKIIVDDDWKSSAKAEKEKLAAAEKQQAEEAHASGGFPDKLGFKELISLFATQALMYMGAIPDQSGRAMVSLEVAKLNIDLLAVVQEKTKGNLSDEEQEMIDGTLKELRMSFVEVARAVEQAAADGTLQQMQDPGVAGSINPGSVSGPDLHI